MFDLRSNNTGAISRMSADGYNVSSWAGGAVEVRRTQVSIRGTCTVNSLRVAIRPLLPARLRRRSAYDGRTDGDGQVLRLCKGSPMMRTGHEIRLTDSFRGAREDESMNRRASEPFPLFCCVCVWVGNFWDHLDSHANHSLGEISVPGTKDVYLRHQAH